MHRLALLLGLLWGYSSTSAQEYVTVVARPKDNITQLLTTHLLGDYGCNYDAFRSINKLKSDVIYIGQTYKLPIEIHTYNSRNIRTTLDIKDFNQALRIQHYNEALYKSGVRTKDFRIDKQLWVPHHLTNCEANKTENAPTTTSGIYPIFGTGYQAVTQQSQALEGHIIYVLSGHGGPDPGAVYTKGKRKYCEDEYAYDIALRLARNLIAHGATAYMIVRDPNDGIRDDSYLPHDTDERCWRDSKIPNGQKERLQQRCDAVNQLYEYHRKQGVSDDRQRAITLHIDSRDASKRLDVFFYHFPTSDDGKQFAQKLQTTLNAQYNKYQKDRGYTGTVKGRDLFVLREIKPTMAFIELGNIQNAADRQRFLQDSNRQALANWLLKGIINAQTQ